MPRPRLLDLFCGAGGAGYGYYLAGFDVTGVDHKPMKRHPQNEHMRFVQADALEYALAYGWQYDAIHASPPCQTHSQITPDKSKHVDLIPHTRFVFESLGLPYIIENVYGAKKALRNPVMLCGGFFGLKVYRHRLFESNILLLVPSHAPHRDNTPRAGHGVSDKGFISITSGGHKIDDRTRQSILLCVATQTRLNTTYKKNHQQRFYFGGGSYEARLIFHVSLKYDYITYKDALMCFWWLRDDIVDIKTHLSEIALWTPYMVNDGGVPKIPTDNSHSAE